MEEQPEIWIFYEILQSLVTDSEVFQTLFKPNKIHLYAGFHSLAAVLEYR